MISLAQSNERLLPLQEVCRLLPSHTGKPLAFATVWRWVQTGVKSPTGERVRLQACKLGGRLLTSKTALDEFMKALTPDFAGGGIGTVQATRSANKRRRATEKAAAELKKMGV